MKEGFHSMVLGLKAKAGTMLAAARTSLRRYRGGTHHRKWGDSHSLSADWDSRTEQIARLIPPGTTVLEFGAGRMVLRKYLPEGCKYTPSDLVDRGDGTIVCDLNARDLPSFPPHDVAVFSGVLEYVNDLDRLFERVSKSFNVIVASYCDRQQFPSRVMRRSQGWVNDFTPEELQGIFCRLGFHCDRVESWNVQKIYRFVRRQPTSVASAAAGGESSASSTPAMR